MEENKIENKTIEICKDCGKKAEVKFNPDGVMAEVHGWGTVDLCKPCFIKRIERHIKDCQDQIKEMKGELQCPKKKKKR